MGLCRNTFAASCSALQLIGNQNVLASLQHCHDALHQAHRGLQTLAEARQGEAKPLNLCNAVNEALHQAMDSNDKALVFGEDVAFGGVFRCTVGLLERFGRRVFNTPLAEQVGTTTAAAGLMYQHCVYSSCSM
eukprot:GHUV01029891.1.p1 GENE.GHUV01029891.1~~GHUV01029891.1.p1  ORF type:complete len:133 (-),score=32.71 GHUV01029891.1:323-721(-)